MEKKIADAIRYALSFVGTRYHWGGESPMQGYDCSGYVQEILRSMGLDPRGDQTAQDLFNYFQINGTPCQLQAGALAFYGDSRIKIRHVAFCINSVQIIEAGGGSRKVNSVQTAIDQRAFVRVRPALYRTDFIQAYAPYY